MVSHLANKSHFIFISLKLFLSAFSLFVQCMTMEECNFDVKHRDSVSQCGVCGDYKPESCAIQFHKGI